MPRPRRKATLVVRAASKEQLAALRAAVGRPVVVDGRVGVLATCFTDGAFNVRFAHAGGSVVEGFEPAAFRTRVTLL